MSYSIIISYFCYIRSLKKFVQVVWFIPYYMKMSRFIGFNPRRERALEAFLEAGVPVVEEKDLSLIWPYIFPGENIS